MTDFLTLAKEVGLPWAIAIGVAIAYWRSNERTFKFLNDTICEALGELTGHYSTITTILDERLRKGGGSI